MVGALNDLALEISQQKECTVIETNRLNKQNLILKAILILDCSSVTWNSDLLF